MASITLTGTLLDPTGEVAVGDQIRFTHRTTTGETIQFARSVLIIPPNGLYNITLEFGLIFVEYLDIKDVNYKSLGVVTVNQDSTATDLPGLLNAIVPPTDAQLLLFQGILQDTEDARDIALLAAAQQTTLELIASTTTHPNSTVLTLSGHTLPGDGGGGKWQLNGAVGQTTSQSPTQLADFLLNDGNGNQWALVDGVVLAFNAVQYLPLPFGATGNGNYAYNNNDFDKIVDPDRLNPATLADWQNDTSAQAGDKTTTKERSTGEGGGGVGDVIAGIGTVNGTSIVQHGSLSLSWVLRDLKSATVRQYGAATTGDSKAAIQKAADNGYLDFGDLNCEIASGITLPIDVIIRSRNAVMKRQTGAVPPFDMMVGTDLTGLDIQGRLTFDGNKDADSLVQANADDRFCGLRLIRCTGTVEDVEAINTVNGEIQVEGIRAGIMFEDCDGLEASSLFASNNDGSGVFPHTSAMTIRHVRTHDHPTGSGFTSFGCDDAEFHDIESKTSGFSGVSVNGKNMKCSDLRGEGAANGFANVNIGHDDPLNTADGSIIRGIKSKSSLGWGITVVGSKHVNIIGMEDELSADSSCRIFNNSDFVKISSSKLASGLGNGLAVDSGTNNSLCSSEIFDFDFIGLSITNGAHIDVDDSCNIHDNATDLTPNTGNIVCNAATCKISGKVLDSLVDNIIVVGAAGRVFLDNARVSGAAGVNFKSLSSGVIEHHRTRLSDDPLTGQFTATAGAASVIANTNSVNINGITLQPRNSAARAFEWNVASIVEGTSFTINFSGSLAGTEVYSFQLN